MPARQSAFVGAHLPAPVSSFIGRTWELHEVRKLVERERLVTLTGAGGCGKTRLALAAAADLVDAHPGGVWFADLGPVGDAFLVPQAVAVALGVREEPGRTVIDTLIEALGAKGVLVVLDNCEHVVEAAARLADALLRGCPGLRILATSREVLGIPGEVIFRVPSLSVPPEPAPLDRLLEYESVRLFVERATAVQPKLELSDENAAAVASICTRLDGIPLAVELAAARAAVLIPHQIAARLDDRFRLLVGGSRAALPRHQTLLATLDWSYDLLGPAEQALLRRLSVFAGGFAIEAAEAIGSGPGVVQADVFDLLAQVVDKSLLVMEPEARGARYRMLQTIRAYAGQKLQELGEEEAARGRHLAWFTALAQEAEPGLTGPEQGVWLEHLEADHADLQAALAWATEHRPGEAALRLGGALLRFWEARGYWSEGRAALEGALAGSGDAPSALRAKALWAEGLLAGYQDDYPAARQLLEASLVISRQLADLSAMPRSLNALGMLALNEEDLATGGALFEEALAIYRQLGDRPGMARSLLNLGVVARRREDYSAARSLYDEGLAVFREVGDRVGVGNCLNNLGLVLFSQGDYPAARSLIEEALATCEPGDRQQRAGRLESLGRVASEQGDWALARSYYQESLALSRELGSRELIAFCLEGLGRVAASEGCGRRAARLRGAAEGLREAMGCPVPHVERSRYERDTAALRSALGEDAFASAWAEGRTMAFEEALAYAAQDASDLGRSEPPLEQVGARQ